MCELPASTEASREVTDLQSSPGIYPEGIKSIEEVNEEYEKRRKEYSPMPQDENGVKFEPAFFRLAMPETESEANRDLETLEALAVPTPPSELANIPKHLWDKHRNKSLNIVWVRELVRLHTEDKQTAHTAAALPMGALNKGTETLETTFQKVFQTSCTAKKKSKFCRGYTYPDRLMPCRIYEKQPNGEMKAVGIEDKCDCCFN